jgi:hypothetical protein
MDSVFACVQCCHSYDELRHKPLSLPCGHVFCQQCLSLSSVLVCPTDKSRFDMPLSSLPCCYAILSSLPKTAGREACCLRHPTKKVKFQCKAHDKFLCSSCVVEHSGAGHNIVSFTVNSLAVKSDLRDLLHICESTRQEQELPCKEVDARLRVVKEFYHGVIGKINAGYEAALKSLQNKKREMVAAVAKHLSDQCRGLERQKEAIFRVVDCAAKVLGQVKTLQEEMPHYELLCLSIKAVRQEIRGLETTVEGFQPQFFGLKCLEPFTVIASAIEEVTEGVENEAKHKCKNCTHGAKGVLQTANLNETPIFSCKSTVIKGEKHSGKEEKQSENKSPEKCGKSRGNCNARNHPKRMPWKKRNRSL